MINNKKTTTSEKTAGRVGTTNKTRIIIRVDEEVVAEFKSKAEKKGTNYHHMMNEALKQYLEGQDLLDAIQKTIREELQNRDSLT